MTRVPCKRGWEVEALVDGRLVGKDRASLERHVETCEDCGRSVMRMRELGGLLSALPTTDRTSLERRRERADLLTRANERLVGGEGRRSGFWVALALVPAVAVLAVLLARPAATVAVGPALPPSAATLDGPPASAGFEVTDVDHASFTTEQRDATSRVALRSGTASFHVEHVRPGARFVVALPDGEVEVRGTRFVLEVADGHTRSVVVTEGVVEVRLREFSGLLRAGERWPRAPVAAPVSRPQRSGEPTTTGGHAASSVPADATGVAAAVGAAAVSTAIAAAGSAATSPAEPSAREVLAGPLASVAAEPGPASGLTGPGPRFAAAMSAYNAGDYGEAERRFVAFGAEFPSDSRAEDAMFLLAEVRARRGDLAGAREAARAYLRRFPAGLRAPAATRLARDTPAAPAPPP